MGYLDSMGERVKRYGAWEISLAQAAAMFLALVVAKLVPQILTINVWWFVLAAVLCGLRPFYVFFVRA